jgi:hypothetical protein
MQVEELDRPKETTYVIAQKNNIATAIALLVITIIVFVAIAGYATNIQNKVDLLITTNIKCVEVRGGK